MYAAFKSALLAVALAILFMGTKPPTPPPAQEKVYYRRTFDVLVRSFAYIWHVTFFVVACCESITLFELERAQIHEPSETLKRLCHTQPSAAATHLLTLSPTFVLSVLLMCGAGLLRMWCYRTLGRFFTFDVAILDGHVLITSGPYAYVRHPSYTGTATLLLGTFLEFFGPQSYLRVCNLTNTAPVRVLSICIPLAIYSVVSLYKRTLVEDRRLKAEFGKDWEAYLKAVPCKLIPYVL